MEAPGSLGSPLRKWSKVTSGMVLGDQEAPDRWVGRQGCSSWAEIQELRVEKGKMNSGFSDIAHDSGSLGPFFSISHGTPVLTEKRHYCVLLR